MIKKNSRNSERVRRHARVRAKVKGSEKTPRVVVFRSNKNIEVQVINDDKNMTLLTVSSKGLKLKNGGNIEAAKKVGAALAEACKAKKITTVVFDRGGYIYHGRVEALAEEARKGGLKF